MSLTSIVFGLSESGKWQIVVFSAANALSNDITPSSKTAINEIDRIDFVLMTKYCENIRVIKSDLVSRINVTNSENYFGFEKEYFTIRNVFCGGLSFFTIKKWKKVVILVSWHNAKSWFCRYCNYWNNCYC